jgi:hypothetical protein
LQDAFVVGQSLAEVATHLALALARRRCLIRTFQLPLVASSAYWAQFVALDLSSSTCLTSVWHGLAGRLAPVYHVLRSILVCRRDRDWFTC